MIRAVGGAYTWFGAGTPGPAAGLHGDRYDFNDELVPIGLRYWVSLAGRHCPRRQNQSSSSPAPGWLAAQQIFEPQNTSPQSSHRVIF